MMQTQIYLPTGRRIRRPSLAEVALVASPRGARSAYDPLVEDDRRYCGLGGSKGLHIGTQGPTIVAWTPASLGSAVLWLNSQTGITIGTGVSQWNDQVGTNNAVQATGAAQPTNPAAVLNGKATVKFTKASSQFMTVAHNAALNANQFTVHVIMRANAFTAFQGYVTKQTTSGFADGWGVNNGPSGVTQEIEGWVNTYNTRDAFDSSVANGTWALWSFVYDQVAPKLYLNGTLKNTGAGYAVAVSGSTNPVTIGCYSNTGGPTFAGFSDSEFTDIIYQGAAISGGDMTSLHTWAQTQYGLP